MHNLNWFFILVALCAYISPLTGLSPVRLNRAPPQSELDTHNLPVLDLSYTAGKTVGIDVNYASVGIFYSPMPCWCNIQPFVDLRANRLEDNLWATSTGAGLRFLCDDCNSVVGFNGFYDYRGSKLGDFHQAGFGFEWISSRWQFNLNGYIPFKNKYIGPIVVFDDYVPVGNVDFVLTCQKSTYSRRGGDFEFGRSCGCYDSFLFYLGAGSYYFQGTPGRTYGLKLRSVFSMGGYMSLEGTLVYDKSCDFLAQFTFSLYLPLDLLCNICAGKPSSCCDCRFLLQPVNRSDMINLKNKCCWEEGPS